MKKLYVQEKKVCKMRLKKQESKLRGAEQKGIEQASKLK